jgi:acetyltransferase-like isoleucine patch superfamily enzyme
MNTPLPHNSPVDERTVPAMTPQQKKMTESVGGFAAYKELAVGADANLFGLFYYELTQILFGDLAGLLGYGTRALSYPALFASCGKKTAFGRGMVVRNPNKIDLARKVLCDDYTTLDARGADARIQIDECVSLARFSALVARNGIIKIGKGCNIGSYTRIGTESSVELGESVLIAGYCYIGPGNHLPGTADEPLISRPMDIRGGVSIGAHTWLGARVTVVDGVKIGEGCIIGAHSLVLSDIPPRSVAIGAPAKVIRTL